MVISLNRLEQNSSIKGTPSIKDKGLGNKVYVIKRVDCSTMSCIIVLQYYEHIIGRAEGGDHWHNRLHLVALENSINFGHNKCGRAYSLNKIQQLKFCSCYTG